MKRILLTLLVLPVFAFAQIGIGTNTPEVTLDVVEATPATPTASAGIGVPQVDVLPSSGNRPGQLVLLTTDNLFYYFNGTIWTPVSTTGLEYGDIKTGIQSNDHNGWLLLDGRVLSSLTSSQQTQATTLGLSGNLPDARDKYLSYSPSGGANFGSNSVSLTKANLPTDAFTGTTDYVNNNDLNVNPGEGGLIRRSVSGENITANAVDNNGSGNEPDILSSPQDHNHSFSLQLNNSQTAIDNRPATLNVSMFIYLGN